MNFVLALVFLASCLSSEASVLEIPVHTISASAAPRPSVKGEFVDAAGSVQQIFVLIIGFDARSKDSTVKLQSEYEKIGVPSFSVESEDSQMNDKKNKNPRIYIEQLQSLVSFFKSKEKFFNYKFYIVSSSEVALSALAYSTATLQMPLFVSGLALLNPSLKFYDLGFESIVKKLSPAIKLFLAVSTEDAQSTKAVHFAKDYCENKTCTILELNAGKMGSEIISSSHRQDLIKGIINHSQS